MASNARRDLTFGILSDASKLDLGRPAAEFDDLADSATRAGRETDRGLETVGQAARETGKHIVTLGQDSDRGLDALDRAAKDSAKQIVLLERTAKDLDLDTLGRDAKRTADRVDNAFDTIARASRQSARKVDDDTDKVRRSFDDVSDEARDTGREMAASFDGTGDGLLDAIQEFSANAGAQFGPLAAGFSIVVGSLVGLWRAEQEKLEAEVEDLVQYMKDAGGRMSEEAINARIMEMDPQDLADLRDFADAMDIAGVTYGTLARAKAGDEEAQRSLNEALDEARVKYADLTTEAGTINGVHELMQARILDTQNRLDEWTGTTDLARQAIKDYGSAVVRNTETAAESVKTAQGAWDDLSGAMSDPIRARIHLQKPSRSDFIRVRQDMTRSLGTLLVPVKPGQSRFANTAANSRYKD